MLSHTPQLSQVHDHLTALEKAMETDLSRARSLSGVDPNTGQLRVAMEKVQCYEYTTAAMSSINRLRIDWLL